YHLYGDEKLKNPVRYKVSIKKVKERIKALKLKNESIDNKIKLMEQALSIK
ncbi:unnamed protein product, partial [marine sediment metagenome]